MGIRNPSVADKNSSKATFNRFHAEITVIL